MVWSVVFLIFCGTAGYATGWSIASARGASRRTQAAYNRGWLDGYDVALALRAEREERSE